MGKVFNLVMNCEHDKHKQHLVKMEYKIGYVVKHFMCGNCLRIKQQFIKGENFSQDVIDASWRMNKK